MFDVMSFVFYLQKLKTNQQFDNDFWLSILLQEKNICQGSRREVRDGWEIFEKKLDREILD